MDTHIHTWEVKPQVVQILIYVWLFNKLDILHIKFVHVPGHPKMEDHLDIIHLSTYWSKRRRRRRNLCHIYLVTWMRHKFYISYMLREFRVWFEKLVGWAIHIAINTKSRVKILLSVFGVHILKRNLTSVEICLGLVHLLWMKKYHHQTFRRMNDGLFQCTCTGCIVALSLEPHPRTRVSAIP